MYMPGRSRTASRPSRTVMSLAAYVWRVAVTNTLLTTSYCARGEYSVAHLALDWRDRIWWPRRGALAASAEHGSQVGAMGMGAIGTDLHSCKYTVPGPVSQAHRVVWCPKKTGSRSAPEMTKTRGHHAPCRGPPGGVAATCCTASVPNPTGSR